MPDITANAAPAGVPAYLAAPSSGRGPWPGVVVLHELFGLNDDIRQQADRLAAAGFLALAPDLYTGGPRLRCIMRAFRDLSSGRGTTFDAIGGVRDWLAAREDCTGRVAVIGFCMGGGFALLAAARYDFAAAAVNYGNVPKDAAEVLKGTCPQVASFGGRDRMTRGSAARLERALTTLQVPHDVKVYPDAGHGFMNTYTPGPPFNVFLRVMGGLGHKPAEASDAWDRITGFFRTYLTGEQEGR